MKKIANRTLTIDTFLTEEGRLLASGRLADDRVVPFKAFEGGVVRPGCFHDLKAELTLTLPDLVIASVKVFFDKAPVAVCSSVSPIYQGLVGVRVATGYTKAVLTIAGGVRGCSHLTHLLIVMGPAIVQGAFTALAAIDENSRPLVDNEVNGEQMDGYFYDSCHVWKR